MSDKPHHLVLVEDDPEIGAMVVDFMTDHGFKVSRLSDGRGLDRVMASGKVDLVVLDLMLPGEDGLSICRRLRARSPVPIIILTALGEDTDRIVGLEMGADDYIPKPFNPRELVARSRAVLRRAAMSVNRPANEPVCFVFDGWRLDLAFRHLTSPDETRLPLTTGEFNMLATFCQNARTILSREQLIDLIHGRASGVFDRAVDIQVSRLRRKIEPDPRDPTLIKTVRHGGYVFTPLVTQIGSDP